MTVKELIDELSNYKEDAIVDLRVIMMINGSWAFFRQPGYQSHEPLAIEVYEDCGKVVIRNENAADIEIDGY